MTHWQTLASCRTNPDLWFSEKAADQRYAREVCHWCPVRADCMAEMDHVERAIPFPDWHGIAAGENPRERRRRRGWVWNGARWVVRG